MKLTALCYSKIFCHCSYSQKEQSNRDKVVHVWQKKEKMEIKVHSKKKTECMKSKDCKGKVQQLKKREELSRENGSASHLASAGGLMNYLIAYPLTHKPLILWCPFGDE